MACVRARLHVGVDPDHEINVVAHARRRAAERASESLGQLLPVRRDIVALEQRVDW